LSTVPGVPHRIPIVVIYAHDINDCSSLRQSVVNDLLELYLSVQVGESLSNHHVVFSLSLGSEDGTVTLIELVIVEVPVVVDRLVFSDNHFLSGLSGLPFGLDSSLFSADGLVR